MINNAQILERDAQHVAMVQLLQRGEVRAGGAGKADMLQVALGIHRVSRMRKSRHKIAGFAAFVSALRAALSLLPQTVTGRR